MLRSNHLLLVVVIATQMVSFGFSHEIKVFNGDYSVHVPSIISRQKLPGKTVANLTYECFGTENGNQLLATRTIDQNRGNENEKSNQLVEFLAGYLVKGNKSGSILKIQELHASRDPDVACIVIRNDGANQVIVLFVLSSGKELVICTAYINQTDFKNHKTSEFRIVETSRK